MPNNPIPKSDLWATITLDKIQELINTMPSKSRAEVNLIFMYTLNACHKLVEDQK